jgi:hypothetical protein
MSEAKMVKGAIKGRPNKKTTPELVLSHYHLLTPIEVTSIGMVADAAEQIAFLSVRQQHDVADALHAIYNDVPTHRSWSPTQARRKTGYCFQEACFIANASLAAGRDKARKNAQMVFHEPDVQQDITTAEEETPMAKKAAAVETPVVPATPVATEVVVAKRGKPGKTPIVAEMPVTPAPAAPASTEVRTGTGQRGVGIRVKTFKVGKKTYDLSKKGFGMLGVVACENPTLKINSKGDDKMRAHTEAILRQRDADCGKPPLDDYGKKVTTYMFHAHKHLAGLCECSELNTEMCSNPPMLTK